MAGHRARLVAALAAAGLIVAACSQGPTPSPSGAAVSPAAPSGEASVEPGSIPPESLPPTAEPSASPTRAPNPVAAIQPNTAAKVIVKSLNVREWPTTSATRIGSLSKGDIVILLGYGGIKANGYVWFQAGRLKGVQGQLPALPDNPIRGGTWSDLFGWIAVGTGTTPYITPLAPRCPAAAPPDLATLSAMLPGEQLDCLGDMPLSLQGTWGCSGCGGAFLGVFKPQWLATPLSGFLSVSVAELGPLQLYFPPGVDRPAEGTILSVSGHLADARSANCKVSIQVSDNTTAAPVAIRARDAVTWCRQHVVVDSYDVLGTDPSWPPG
jgi:hypothetical protein